MPKTTTILRGSAYKPARGGHAPGDVRDAFVDEAIPAFIEWKDGPEPTVELREQQITISQLCGLLWNCHDILPGSAVDDLKGCDSQSVKSWSYGAAARWMKAECAAQNARGGRLS